MPARAAAGLLRPRDTSESQELRQRGRPENPAAAGWRCRIELDKVRLPPRLESGPRLKTCPPSSNATRPRCYPHPSLAAPCPGGIAGARATVALVPTMGALHDGHLALVRQAKRRASKVVVSIFVNPTQFAPHEDLGSYPRTFDADLDKLAARGVDLVWAPTAASCIPAALPPGSRRKDRRCRSRRPFPPAFLRRRRDRRRKLFAQCRPDVAIFGEKDLSAAQGRDPNGRATSISASRSSACRSCARRTASRCPRATSTCRPMIVGSRRLFIARSRTAASTLRRANPIAEVARPMARQRSTAGFTLDYFDVRDAETLAPLDARQTARSGCWLPRRSARPG